MRRRLFRDYHLFLHLWGALKTGWHCQHVVLRWIANSLEIEQGCCFCNAFLCSATFPLFCLFVCVDDACVCACVWSVVKKKNNSTGVLTSSQAGSGSKLDQVKTKRNVAKRKKKKHTFEGGPGAFTSLDCCEEGCSTEAGSPARGRKKLVYALSCSVCLCKF